MGKQTKKKVDTLKSLNLSNKTDESNQVESIFFQNQLIDLIIDRIEEIMQLQNNIKLDKLEYKSKRGKCFGFSDYSLPVNLLRDIQERNLSLEVGNKEQIQLANELRDVSKGNLTPEKISF